MHVEAKANNASTLNSSERTNTFKEREGDRRGDKGANSTASMMFEEKGRPTGEKPEKIHHCAGYASRHRRVDRMAFAARVHVIHPISYVL